MRVRVGLVVVVLVMYLIIRRVCVFPAIATGNLREFTRVS